MGTIKPMHQTCQSCHFWTPTGDDRGICARTVMRVGVPDEPTSVAIARSDVPASTVYLETHALFRCDVWHPDGEHANVCAQTNTATDLVAAMRNDLATAMDTCAGGAPTSVKLHALRAALGRTDDRLHLLQWREEQR